MPIDYANLHYALVWSDEFDYAGPPDPAKWRYDTGGSGWGNGELQYYTDGANAYVGGGELIIELRREEMFGRDCTSSRMVTKGRGDWLYGRIEVRAKLPAGLGTWPAIWMLPSESKHGGWPDGGEIDIMEHVGYDQGNIHATVHTGAYNHIKGTQKGGVKHYDDVDAGYHVYAVEWLPEYMRFFVDDEEIFYFNPGDYTDEITGDEWPFDQKFHLLLNIAFGGSWGGANGVDYDIMPVTMNVDYVRVYQADEINNKYGGD